METPPVRNLDDLTDEVRAAPRDAGRIELIVRRPGPDRREVISEATLDPEDGLVGDDWFRRSSLSTPDGSADPESQLTIMCTRVLAAIAPERSLWPLAGDQICADFDLGIANIPPGTRLAIGDAEVVVTSKLHTGCSKFAARFGKDALDWISGPAGKELRMRGVYVRIVRGAVVRPGDMIRKIAP
jgi:hypothetical protein